LNFEVEDGGREKKRVREREYQFKGALALWRLLLATTFGGSAYLL